MPLIIILTDFIRKMFRAGKIHPRDLVPRGGIVLTKHTAMIH